MPDLETCEALSGLPNGMGKRGRVAADDVYLSISSI